jgi:hypothetical protein
MIGLKDFSILILHTYLLDVLGYSCTCLLPEESVSFEMACIQSDLESQVRPPILNTCPYGDITILVLNGAYLKLQIV